jgi:hypothetical protein
MNNPFSATGAFSGKPFACSTQEKTVTPYTEQYNLAVEHQFGGGFDLRVGYVGQHNREAEQLWRALGTTTPNLNLAEPAGGRFVGAEHEPRAAIFRY